MEFALINWTNDVQGRAYSMTNFLPAGIINERLEELVEKTSQLEELLKDREDVHAQLAEIREIAKSLEAFMQSFSCQPLIYTGRGTTEEVIDRLEWILTFADVEQPMAAGKRKRRNNRKKTGLK